MKKRENLQNKSSFFIVGKHPVIEALKNPDRKVLRVFLTEESKKTIHRTSPHKNLLKDQKVYFKTKKELDKYIGKDQILHQGFVAEVEHLNQIDLKSYISNKNNITFACLDGVTDPRNIGSIIRSASLFDIDGLIVKDRNYPKDSKQMYKAASGGFEHVNIFSVSNIKTTIKFLREKNFWVYGFDTNSNKELTKINWKGNNIILFGSEGYGLKKHTEKYVDFFVKIETNNNIDSLNISNSAAIAFHYITNSKK